MSGYRIKVGDDKEAYYIKFDHFCEYECRHILLNLGNNFFFLILVQIVLFLRFVLWEE